MRKKGWLAFLLCFSLTIPGPCVMAEEPLPEKPTDMSQELGDISKDLMPEKEEPGKQQNLTQDTSVTDKPGIFDRLGTDMDAVFAEMDAALGENEEFTLSESISSNSEKPLSQNPMFDISNMDFMTETALDIGAANLKYDALSESLLKSQSSVNLKGNAKNSMELFQNTYGDLSKQISLTEPKIPKEFNPGKMLKSASKNISSMYKKASSSKEFTTIKGNVSVGNIFAIANQGVSAPKLKPMGSLNDMIAKQSSADIHKYQELYQNQQGSVKDHVSINEDMMISSVNEKLLNLVDMDSSLINMDGDLNTDNIDKATETTNDIYEENSNHKRKILWTDPIGLLKEGGLFIKNTINNIGDDVVDWVKETYDKLEKQSK